MIQPDQQRQDRFRRRKTGFLPVLLLSLLLLIITASFWLYFAPIEPDQTIQPPVSSVPEKTRTTAAVEDKPVTHLRQSKPSQADEEATGQTVLAGGGATPGKPHAVQSASKNESAGKTPSREHETAPPKARQLSVKELQDSEPVIPPAVEKKPEEGNGDSEQDVVSSETEEPTDVQPVTLEESSGGDLTAVSEEEKKVLSPCEQLQENLSGFFHHLDQSEYIQKFELGENTQSYFITLTRNLLDNPPVVIKESDDLYTILTNMAHFFRVIGRKNILLIKSIFDRERDKIEDVAADLYRWIFIDQCRDDRFKLEAPLAKIYEYAGFFLNTMGGRSYLFRRDSRYRLLINYYSVLVIDQANRADMNRYGLDITETVRQLAQEIEGSDQLIYKENYLDQLYDLQEKYQ